MDAAAHRGGHRRPGDSRSGRPRNGGDRQDRAFSCTRAASSITPTACRTCSARSTSCSPPAGSASPTAATARSPARPTARAAASTARSAINFPAGATSATPSIARYIAGVWGIDDDELPGPGVDAYEMFRKIDARRDQGPALDLLQSEGLAARQQLRHALRSRSSSSTWRSISS